MFNASEQPGELVIKLPPFWQLVKAGAALAIGAVLPSFIAVFAVLAFAVIFGTFAALGTAVAPRAVAPTAAPSALHHR